MARRVVCIEDEQDIIDLMRLIIERHGLEFTEASGGDKGIQIVKRIKPDLVLLDLMMPGIDGWVVYDALKADLNTKDIPIIIVTARVHHDERVMKMRVGKADNLVTKPFAPAELIATIDRVLNGSTS